MTHQNKDYAIWKTLLRDWREAERKNSYRLKENIYRHVSNFLKKCFQKIQRTLKLNNKKTIKFKKIDKRLEQTLHQRRDTDSK